MLDRYFLIVAINNIYQLIGYPRIFVTVRARRREDSRIVGQADEPKTHFQLIWKCFKKSTIRQQKHMDKYWAGLSIISYCFISGY